MHEFTMHEFTMRIVAAVVLASAALTAGAAESSPEVPPYLQAPNGMARLQVNPERDAATGEVLLPLVIDLKDVTWNNEPLVLGAYVVRVKFDRDRVAFVGASAGLDPYFAASPIATAPEIANAQGWAKITYAQLNTLQPIGMVDVARLRFAERAAGGAESIEVVLESVSSAIQRDADGHLMRKLSVRVTEAVASEERSR